MRSSRRRRRRALTSAARALLLALAATAFLRRGAERPGDVMRHPPALVVAPATAAPATSTSAAPGAVATAASSGASDAARRRTKPLAMLTAPKGLTAPALFRSLRERAGAGEQVGVEVTAYCLKGTTRRGNYVRAGIVAADPKVFPLAKHIDVYIGRRYFGRYLVDDTGKDIKGNRLDLWTESCRDARFFGRRFGHATLVMRDAAAPGEPEVGPSLR